MISIKIKIEERHTICTVIEGFSSDHFDLFKIHRYLKKELKCDGHCDNKIIIMYGDVRDHLFELLIKEEMVDEITIH
jgi:translation initiation factor 1 (eIF-1/SUI1)